jgi:Zn-dependent protease with chaperone function
MTEVQYLNGACETCGGHIEFPAEGLSLSAACPHCGEQTLLLETLGQPGEGSPSLTAAELKAAFGGPAGKYRVSFIYQLALLWVTAFMVILPLAYVGLIAALGYAVYWYARFGLGMFASFIGGFYVLLFKVLLYLGPLVGGAVAVFFMLKPILARRRSVPQALSLDPVANPRLYEFIAHISERVGAPMPRRIYLDCELGASARFRRGWLSFFGRDLVLTIGLPFAAGLTARQLSAVVAHELGHFNQPVAMRLHYVASRINGWFWRVVHERDAWDESMDDWARSVGDSRLAIIVLCAQLGVWLSRRVLKLLMNVGHAASCFLSRQMENNADRIAIAITGSEGQESTLLRTRELAVLQSMAWQGLNQFWTKRRQLPDNLPEFLTHVESKMPANFKEHAHNTLLNETAGLFATHPTSAQRIRLARRAEEPGIFRLDLTAAVLFGDFALLSRMVTHSLYRDEMRLPVLPTMLKPTHEFIK